MSEASKPKKLSSNLFPVVGIGASAGGLEAFKKLLKAIPENSGIAYVLVQHLDPTHESMLPEILQKVTKVPVLEISDDIKVKPDHIYILPSNKMLVANDGVLQLSPRVTKKNERNLPIDLFFLSLAQVHQDHAIGVVLSGTGSDGTKGLMSIKEHGGITLAQNEESAAYDGMPKSAIVSGVVDFILTPEEMPQKLLDITNTILKSDEHLKSISQLNGEIFSQILTLIRIRKGNDFTYYKQSTIRRRIFRRMALNKFEAPADYLQYVKENKPEQDILYQDLLIPVTSFFRDPKSFLHLCKVIIPLILKDKNTEEPIRVWVAGCSTGQEAFSIAICFREFLAEFDGLGPSKKVQIFATDLSEPAILKARKGIYTQTEVEGISPQRMQEFFTRANGGYQLNKQVREMCVFASHNFLTSPPFGKMDFISCRNVLIYMEPYLQKKALTTFHYALNPKGYLWLGKSETISSVPDLFISAAKNDKLFCRKDVPARFMHTTSLRSEQNLRDLNSGTKSENIQKDFQKVADDIMLSKYTPAGVVVNESMDIVHFRGMTSQYLEQLPGKPSHNLLKMAKDGLAFELRNLLHKVKKDNVRGIKENIPLQIDGHTKNISIEAFPLNDTIDLHYLVLFHDYHLSGDSSTNGSAKGNKKTSSAKAEQNEQFLRIQQLEKELAQSRDDMRAITEDQEAVNEELQSANEELLSGSEELQSLNEELESSKEELQSTNEELTVINQEMINLNEQIIEARDYAQAIVANLRTPLLVLDHHLRIKSANSAFYKTFQVNEAETEGRLIYDIGNRDWDILVLRRLLEQVLPEQSTITDYEINHHFRSIGNRTMLLNAHEIIKGDANEKEILISIEDITQRTQHLLKEKELLSRFHNIVIQAPVSIAILKGVDLIVEIVNAPFLKIIDKSEHEVIGKPLFVVLPGAKAISESILPELLKTGRPYLGNEMEFTFLRAGKTENCYFNFVFQPLRDIDESITGIICMASDVTSSVMARKSMEIQHKMFDDMLMTAPAFVCTMTGPDHVYDLVNERYQQLFGKRIIQGKAVMDALPELKGQGIDKLLDDVYTTGVPFVGIDIPLMLARDENLEPELRYFNFSYQPMYDVDQKIYAIIVFGYEVTDQVNLKLLNIKNQEKRAKELEIEVQQRTAQLSVANESLWQKNMDLGKMNVELQSFNYVSSHDLQEPLRKIQIFASHILDKEMNTLTDKGQDYFYRMQTAANRMQGLIQDLLAFSSLSKTDRKFEMTNLQPIIDEVVTELHECISEKEAVIESSELSDVRIIPFQFRQLLQNLVSNAVKFSSPHRIPHVIIKSHAAKELTLINEKLSPNKEYFHVSVEDNGVGFDPQYREKVFEVFERVHDKDLYPGSGIGLAIVKKIVENHNGIITATSVEGQGTTFDIYFPAEN